MTLTKFLRTSAAALGALAVASAANAADIYTSGMKEAPVYIPPPVWTGFYIGAHIGAAWESIGNQNMQFDDWGAWGCGTSCTYAYSPAILHPSEQSNGDAFGGVQFGYNFQSPGAFVYGIEVDLGGMALNGHAIAHGATSYADSNSYSWSTPVMMNEEGQGGFYGDVTGRLGWTWGTAMVYAKGGFAWLNTNLSMNESIMDYGQIGCASGGVGWCEYGHSENTTLTGWTLGGGVEWKVSPAWSIKAEYLHFEFDNFNNNCCNDPMYQSSGGVLNNFNRHDTLDVDTVKLGFNYFWNPAPPVPLK